MLVQRTHSRVIPRVAPLFTVVPPRGRQAASAPLFLASLFVEGGPRLLFGDYQSLFYAAPVTVVSFTYKYIRPYNEQYVIKARLNLVVIVTAAITVAVVRTVAIIETVTAVKIITVVRIVTVVIAVCTVVINNTVVVPGSLLAHPLPDSPISQAPLALIYSESQGCKRDLSYLTQPDPIQAASRPASRNAPDRREAQNWARA